MGWRLGDPSREDDWWEAVVVLGPVPFLWVVDRWLLEAKGWPLWAVVVFFAIAWAVLGWLALQLYRAVRKT